MQVEVHIKNGRTVFRFAKREHFIRALRQANDPGHDGKRVICQHKHHVDNPTWDTASVRSINPSSVSYVLEVPADQKMTPDELRQQEAGSGD